MAKQTKTLAKPQETILKNSGNKKIKKLKLLLYI